MRCRIDYFVGFLLLALVGGISTSCRSLRINRVGITTEKEIRSELSKRIEEKKKEKYLLAENASFEYIAENTLRGRLTFYAERESSIFISVKMLGFEMVRAEISKDSIKYINRLRKEFYFGPYKEKELNYLPGMEFDEVMDFIFTGFINLPNGIERGYIRDFDIREDKIIYDKVLEEGRRIVNSYSLSELRLTEAVITDYPNEFLAELELKRDYGLLQEINANYSLKGNLGVLRVTTGKISYEKYKNTDFRIGKNYEELERLF